MVMHTRYEHRRTASRVLVVVVVFLCVAYYSVHLMASSIVFRKMPTSTVINGDTRARSLTLNKIADFAFL